MIVPTMSRELPHLEGYVRQLYTATESNLFQDRASIRGKALWGKDLYSIEYLLLFHNAHGKIFDEIMQV